MKAARIDVSKIDKSAIHVGKMGKYLNVTLIENRNGKDQYGYDGFIAQDIGAERRIAGEKGPIIGNWKNIDKQPQPSAAASYGTNASQLADDDIMF
jgi:hypothetical protein